MKNKAAVLTALNHIEMREIPLPSPKADEVLIKLSAVGICGSDVHYYQHGRIADFVVEFPFILGYEASGVVTQVGAEVTHLKPGDRVCIEPGVPCGQCGFCLSGRYNLCPDVVFLATPPYGGCLMNYLAYPARWTFKLPDSMSLEEGALVEPLAIGINAAKTGHVGLGDTVLVYGAGCIGLVSALAAKAMGAARVVVVDLIEKRLEVAKHYGFIALNSKDSDPVAEVMKLTEGRGADAVLDCVGHPSTIAGAVRAARAGRTIVVVGMAAEDLSGVPLGPLSTKELVLTSIFRYANLFPTTIQAIASGMIDVKGIVSNRYRFEETPAAYKAVVENIRDTVKSVIVFDD